MFGDQPLGPEESLHTLRTVSILVTDLPSRLKHQMPLMYKETSLASDRLRKQRCPGIG